VGVKDRLVLALVRWWCIVRHIQWWRHTIKMTGLRPDPATPVSDIDKFLWRKIFDHNPLFTMACDKIASKEYARSVCPGLKIAEILWIGSDPDKIPDDVLAGNIVIKSNHGAGRYIMVHNGDVDRALLRRSARMWLSRGFGVGRGEWGYKNVDRRIFVERMLVEDGVPIRTEYKFAVSCGQTAYVFVARKVAEGDIQQFHTDRNGRVQAKSIADDERLKHFTAPACFVCMRQFAEKVSAPFDFIRCDLYELDGEVYFSEFAVYPQSGRTSASDELKNLRNALWDLRRSWFLTTPQSGWRRTYATALGRWLNQTPPPQS
jgi:hypothetical protein